MTAAAIVVALDVVEVAVFELGVGIALEFGNALFAESLFRAFRTLL